MNPLTSIPASIAAGTTVNLLRSLSGYPASEGWAYVLRLRGASVLDAEGEAEGDSYAATLSATDTAALAPGNYRYVEQLTMDEEVYNFATGVILVTPDLAASEAGDLQTHEEKTLVLIKAAILGRIPSGMESYQIAGRAISKIPILDLEKLRGTYEYKVWKQQHPGQLMPGAQVRFVEPR